MIDFSVQIDGVDKTGKDQLLRYITSLSIHRYVIQARGLISQLAYSKIYNRNYKYDITAYKNDVFIYLTGNIEDLKIRHKLTNEPKINIEQDLKIFNETAQMLKDNNFEILEFDTSKLTPYEIAKQIINYLENKENTNV